MLARARSVALLGLTGHVVEVEAHLAQGLPGFSLVGLPDTALSEARDRVRAAILNSGERFPTRRFTVGLSPASLPKRGSGYDLALACAVLAGDGALPAAAVEGAVLLGELALDGRVRPVRGVLPSVLAATEAGVERVLVPAANAAEAGLVPGVQVVPVRSLRETVALLRGEPQDEHDPVPDQPQPAASTYAEPRLPGVGLAEARPSEHLDLADVLGQVEARFAIEVAAAGGHHLFLLGPPGAGKTMLARRLPGLLPPLDRDEALEVTAVHSVAGVLPPQAPLLAEPPFCSPHHSASVPALVGGGSGLAQPGAVSLAHRGVLFLDEAPEFPARALDALRQPLESGQVTLARAEGTVRYPARFCLVLAANPCPCARALDDDQLCTCSSVMRRRYLGRLSGPLLDRIDLQVHMRRVSRIDVASDRTRVPTTEVVRARVAEARARARARLDGTPWRTNADVPARELRARFAPVPHAAHLLDGALERGRLTVRGLDRVLRVSWTLADLRERPRPDVDDVARALALRTGGVQGAAA